jgi:SAM-dependent methyltransferase
MTFKDHFSAQSSDYARYRPRYPAALFEYLASIAPTRGRAWDVGTGNGQAAVGLAQDFDKVVATDPSAEQLASAQPHAKVVYQRATAERSPLANSSVDLITVAQAVHWFDLDRFYDEVRRVARPGGVIAIWSYGLAEITPDVDAAVHYLYSDVLGTYWPPERSVIEDGYRTVPFPFPELPTPHFQMTARWSLTDLIGYLGTWSSTQAFIKQHGSNPLDLVEGRLKNAWGSPETVREVSWPLFVRAGRIG